MKLNIETMIPNGDVVAYRMLDDKGTVIGSVIICIYDDYIEVLHINVLPKYRGKGHAKSLVRYLQENYDYIITGWSTSESSGRSLFLSMGFKVKKALHANRTTNLEWEK